MRGDWEWRRREGRRTLKEVCDAHDYIRKILDEDYFIFAKRSYRKKCSHSRKKIKVITTNGGEN